MKIETGEVVMMNGNEAAAFAAKSSRIRVYPSYLITPFTKVSEVLAEYVKKGELDAVYIPMESEHSVAAAATGAALGGVRTFWGSSSHGLAYLHEMLWIFALLRLPMGGYVPSRSLGIWNIKPDFQDFWSMRDLGMLLWIAQSPQEVMDRIVMGYKIGEDFDVRLPATTGCEGFETSHIKKPVELLPQELVDGLLGKYKQPIKHIDFDNPQATGCLSDTKPYCFMKIDMQKVMGKSASVIQKTQDEFYKLFGRRYRSVEKYNWDSPKKVLVLSGSAINTARHTLQKNKIKDTAILGVSQIRPFPAQEIYKALKDVEEIVSLDRAISLGSSGPGILHQEVIACMAHLSQSKDIPLVSGKIAGLGGYDIGEQTILQAISGKKGVFLPEGIEQNLYDLRASVSCDRNSKNGNDIMYSGHRACQGCTMPILLKHILSVLGKKTVVVVPAGCSTIILGFYPQTALGVPLIHSAFAAGASTATGIRAALDVLGKKDVTVVVFAGDGATADIGLSALSSAIERNTDIIYFCYDNGAYMNTGVQRSGTTPQWAYTTTEPWGKEKQAKSIPEIVAAHHPPYVATAGLWPLDDLISKVETAKKIKGFRYIHLSGPCQTGWGFPPNKSIEMSRLAVETGIFPLYEIVNDKLRITYQPKFLPVEQYLKSQKRFASLTKEQIETIQKNINKNYKKLVISENFSNIY